MGTLLFLKDEQATDDLGKQLAGMVKPGDLIGLEGDLGAGKSSLARALIRALAKDERLEVPSPSFALVQPYQFDGFEVLHADLYRLADDSEIAELGVADAEDAIVLVEWIGQAPDLKQKADLIIELGMAPGGKGREAELWFDATVNPRFSGLSH